MGRLADRVETLTVRLKYLGKGFLALMVFRLVGG